MKRKVFLLFLLSCLLTACSSESYPSQYLPSEKLTIANVRLPKESGDQTMGKADTMMIDYSHSDEGYIMAKRITTTSNTLKLNIRKEKEDYYYNISEYEYVSFPLQMGNGSYTLRIMEQTAGDNYKQLFAQTIEVDMSNELLPFLYPSQIVAYDADSESVKKAFELVEHDTTDLERIAHLYEYVITNITYDNEKAKAVANTFVLANPDVTLASKKGICFDYAALLATMLRSQGIPTRLVCGDTDIEYHAWVEVYLQGEGWINPKVFFEKASWSRMDPTFAASNRDYQGIYATVKIY